MVDENNAPEAAETPAAAPETSAADEFAAAFAQFASPGEEPKETAPSPDVEAQEAPPADAEAGDGAAPEPEPEPPQAAAQEAPRFTADEWARVMAAQNQYQQAPQNVQPSPAPERAAPPPVLSKEEVETIQEFRKEWPDVAKAIDVQNKAFANDLLNYVFNQFAEVMTPALQQVESVAERTHVMDIYDFVPDYDQVREPVINWVSQMPQNAFRQYAVNVVEQGSPADIQGLVNQWKMFTGQQVAAPQAQPAPGYAPAPRAPVAPQRRAADPALARAAAAMAPVKSQRTMVVQTEDPNDFDGAFERAAAEARRMRDARH